MSGDESPPRSPFRLPMHVEEHGTGDRPLVLLHGFGGNAYSWRYLLPRLSARYRVFVVDFKGHGAAPKPQDSAYSPADHAELVARMMQGRDLRHATLLGHSMGGGVALLATLRLIEREPDRVDSLVLVAGAALPQAIPPFIGRARIPVLGSLFLKLIPARTLIRWALRTIVYDPEGVTVGQVEAYSQPLMEPGGKRALLEGARRIIPGNADELVAEYPRIRQPTLLLWGENDPVVAPALGERLHAILPDSRLEVIERCGHLPLEERPDECLESILEFLRERDERLEADRAQR